MDRVIDEKKGWETFLKQSKKLDVTVYKLYIYVSYHICLFGSDTKFSCVY